MSKILRKMILTRTIPNGYDGLKQTVSTIAALIKLGAKNSAIVSLARQLRTPARAFAWVQRSVLFVPDPPNVELIQTAPKILATRRGDCDDFTVLLGAILRAMGHAIRITVTQTAGHDFFNHVFPELQTDTGWVAMDASDASGRPGRILGRVRRSQSTEAIA